MPHRVVKRSAASVVSAIQVLRGKSLNMSVIMRKATLKLSLCLLNARLIHANKTFALTGTAPRRQSVKAPKCRKISVYRYLVGGCRKRNRAF